MSPRSRENGAAASATRALLGALAAVLALALALLGGLWRGAPARAPEVPLVPRPKLLDQPFAGAPLPEPRSSAATR